MAQLAYHKSNPYFSSLTRRSYATYDGAFQESLRAGGGAESTLTCFSCILPAQSKSSFNRDPEISLYPKETYDCSEWTCRKRISTARQRR